MSYDANNVKVLFIAGSGRSGSTLLDILLGQIDGYHSTGELRFVWARGFAENQLCGCGKTFKECEFWSAVVREGFGGFENIDHERMEQLRSGAEQRVSTGLAVSAEALEPYTDYFDACRTLYQAIYKVSGGEIIVDSSKNTAHGFVLAAIPQIDLFTVHLIRDSRAVAYSWRRKKVRPEIYWEKRLMGQRKLLSSAFHWNALHRLAELLQHRSKRSALLRYEDLVINPRKGLTGMFNDLGVEQPGLEFLEGLHASLRTSHTVSGNPMRFTNKEVNIKPDNEWQHSMAKRHKWLVTLVTWPLLLRYGYFNQTGPKKAAGTPILSKEN